MTHELKNIVAAFLVAKRKRLKTAMATVVDLDGSSYRKPGVRMLLQEDGLLTGAVSGGCVEKEILNQAQSVFTSGIAKMMTYDGRYRLGCEGILYILIEPFNPNEEFLKAFGSILDKRIDFNITSYYLKDVGENENMGTLFNLLGAEYSLRESFKKKEGFLVFKEIKKPCFQLVIVGAEHDAVQLGLFASNTGWEVTVVAAASEEKTKADFPGIKQMLSVEPEMFSAEIVDENTAVILMTHSYVRDLKYLLALKDSLPIYLGILGPSKRREKLLNELIERTPEVNEELLNRVYGPSGINIGAETAQEIAVSILAEILSVVRNQKPILLKDKLGGIHS
ncbi:XdhC family protein [Aurantibacter crassamenti]|uniref:XdhC family protein n=1 Tax=Aurantibacter crassamenti TaxID=1837375 RepID=UPI00193A82D0|nr:XdhC/CoxI family protein [Aurantibacter crassamenti]MBM1106684.1 XdhC family protein [Aurantibacter crassamenti]